MSVFSTGSCGAIVVGVEGSDGSERALMVAAELAANLGCRLISADRDPEGPGRGDGVGSSRRPVPAP